MGDVIVRGANEEAYVTVYQAKVKCMRRSRQGRLGWR